MVSVCCQAGTPKSFEELETEMLAGQKLQGVLTSNEVQAILKTKGWEAAYPLFTTVNRVVQGKLSPEWVLHYEVRENESHPWLCPNANADVQVRLKIMAPKPFVLAFTVCTQLVFVGIHQWCAITSIQSPTSPCTLLYK